MLPYFINYRRDGYDFEGYWNDGLASYREKKVMDLFDGEKENSEYFSPEMKKLANLGSDSNKFDAITTGLMMKTFIVTSGFAHKVNKKGEEYGWSIATFATPEHIFGKELVFSRYKEEPEESKEFIVNKFCHTNFISLANNFDSIH